MTIQNCPNCGGTHFGSNKCPFISEPSEPAASSAMTREELIQKLLANPRFKMAPKSGKGFVIGGALPSQGAKAR
jgi:hypothetical protein